MAIRRKTNKSSKDIILENLKVIKHLIKEFEGKPLPIINSFVAEMKTVTQTQFTYNQLKELEKEIDNFTQQAAKKLILPLPQKLIPVAKSMATKETENIILGASELKQILQNYHNQVDKYYLKPQVWKTPDIAYQDLLKNPIQFKPKKGGAKNTGKRTGVYTFQNGERSETMLLKQGANVGETVAEYVGGCLYGLTIPEYSARCILAKDDTDPALSLDSVYVGSIFQKTKKTQDGFAAAGYRSRPFFAGTRARLKKLFDSNDSLIRKILDINDDTGHTLEYSAANVLWHGDHDFHTGNVVLVEDENKKKFVKIDHGFSFFNFNRKVVDIFNPLAGKFLSISPKRFLKGEKLIEFYPTNHFWDYAVENKQFYFNAHFVKACEEIVNCKPEAIRQNIEASLKNVQAIYGTNANEAFKQFALRIGMNESEILPIAKRKNADFIRYKIEDHMVGKLIERQASISNLAEYCKKHTAKLDKSRNLISKKLNKKVIKLYDKIRNIEKNVKKNKIDPQVAKNQQAALLKEIEFLKLVQQANDLGILEISATGAFIINSEFYFHNSGKRRLITSDEYDKEMHKMVSNKLLFHNDDNYPLSDESISLLREIRRICKNKEQKSRPNW